MIAFYKNFSLKNRVINYLLASLVLFAGCLFMQSASAQGPIKSGTVNSTNNIFTNVAYNYQDNLCASDALGTITINTINGASFAGYTFRWLDNVSQLLHTRTGLTFQVYEVEITEIANPANKDNIKITITNPTPISIETGSLIKPKCNGGFDGKTNVSVDGGTKFPIGDPFYPYKYRWTRKGATTPIISSDLNFTGPAASYTILVTDANNCTKSLDYDIENAPLFINTLPTKTDNVEFTDLNGSITINLTGGTPAPAPNPYTYEWSFNGVVNPALSGPTQTGLKSGIYTVKVTDANLCVAPLQTVRIEPLSPLTIAPIATDNTCKTTPNGKIDLIVAGGKTPYSIIWDDLATPVTTTIRTGLDNGTYRGTLTDALGAVRTITPQIVGGPDLIDFKPVTFTNNKCFGETAGTISLNVSGGKAPYSYILKKGTAPAAAPVVMSSGIFTIPNLASGSYTISIIDAGNCATATQTVDILPVAALRFTTLNPTVFNVRCSDPNSGSIEVNVTGGLPPYKYEWSNDAANNTPKNLLLTVGTYTLKVTDALQCELPLLTVPIIREAAPITISESALPGKHVNNVCVLNPDLTVQKNGKATIDIVGGKTPFVATWLLNGQPIVLVDNEPLLLRRISIENLESGTYTLLLKDDLGCDATPFIIEITPLKQITSNPTILNQKCVGFDDASITLNPSGGTQFPLPNPYRYAWDGPIIPAADREKSTVSNLKPGTYRVRIQDLNGCPLDTTFTILPAIPLTFVDTVIVKSNTCNGALPNGSIQITIAGGEPPYTYKWDLADKLTGIIIPDALTLADRLPNQLVEDDLRINLNAGNYVVTVTDANLCETKLPAFDPAFPNLKTYEIEAISCDKANISITPDPLMSPNGDGLGNEYFRIDGIEKFPDNQVIIYNRWGMEVFTKRRYNNKDRIFTGTANSALTNTETVLVDGVYYYTIRTVLDKIPRVNKGFIIIKR